ncbi:LAMI_0A04082g1_1 [Lachancea mirantina]|uniref:Phosphomevalonate kinase n=1 Tax=Lachancea mirantina TaxID=1230905 RepID=A0A1G4INS4_9SACH|nr:LAMI_0A04082g1_1 [Lachancea mirantina]
MVESRAFSAPGKALLVGGYLVLEPKYVSYVVALSSRMHAIVTVDPTCNSNNDGFEVTVQSSQFNDEKWVYLIDGSNNYASQELYGSQNKFIEKVLFNVLNLCSPDISKTPDLAVEIFSDAAYHSQVGSIVKQNKFKEFCFHKKGIADVPKTGLGSSAGLVTVLTASLLSFFQPSFNAQSTQGLNLVHKIAQVAHCQAQGKVGSGFDVAAATFGSALYQRFEPALINDLPAADDPNYQLALKNLVNKVEWGYRAEPVSLPKGLRIVMGDVNSGSETTKLVAKVNTWYKENLPRSLDIYKTIDTYNRAFIEGISDLELLSQKNLEEYTTLLKALNSRNAPDSFPAINKVRDAVEGIRRNFRIITEESGADIEPYVQTKLLDNSLKLDGVLTGMVPGAGGYDAIALVTTESSELPIQTKNNPNFASVTWLNLHQESMGILEENPSHYIDLV